MLEKYLDNWFIVNDRGQQCLAGYIYNDPRYDIFTGEFKDKHRVITSPIVNLDLDNNICITRNSIYNLGTKLDILEVPDVKEVHNILQRIVT